MDKDKLSRIEIDIDKNRKRRYRVNKRKLVTTLAALCAIAAVIVVACCLMLPAVDSAAAVEKESAEPSLHSSVIGPTEETDGDALDGVKIVVDAGHGGFDSGAIGISGIYESDLNLKVVEYLEDALESLGAKVVMTRTDADALADTKDADMARRSEIICESGADIVISVHMNSHTDPKTSGPLVIFMEGSVQGQELAESIQASLNSVLDPETDGAARADNLYILKCGLQPSALIECGYLSNEAEETKLKQDDYQKKVAEAACAGIAAYFS